MRVWSVTAMVLVLALSGCTDDSPTLVDRGDEPGVVTDPTDYSYLQNGTDGAGWHIHDYWRGQDVLTVMDQSGGCQGCSHFVAGDRDVVIDTLRPPTDHVVPQGAAWVNVTATWDMDGDHSGVGLWVKSAAMTEPDFVTELEPGKSISIRSTNEDNDPPHQRLSLWEFEFRALHTEGNDGTTIWDPSIQAVVEATRGLEVPPWPPHPDLWQGTAEITLLQESRDSIEANTPPLAFCNGCPGVHRFDDGKIVPYDASTVQVEVVVDPGSAPPTFTLDYHGAASWTSREAAVDQDDPLRRVWNLPIEANADSPYAKQSLWELDLDLDQPTPVEAWRGTYHITVTALKQ